MWYIHDASHPLPCPIHLILIYFVASLSFSHLFHSSTCFQLFGWYFLCCFLTASINNLDDSLEYFGTPQCHSILKFDLSILRYRTSEHKKPFDWIYNEMQLFTQRQTQCGSSIFIIWKISNELKNCIEHYIISMMNRKLVYTQIFISPILSKSFSTVQNEASYIKYRRLTLEMIVRIASNLKSIRQFAKSCWMVTVLDLAVLNGPKHFKWLLKTHARSELHERQTKMHIQKEKCRKNTAVKPNERIYICLCPFRMRLAILIAFYLGSSNALS